MKTKNIPNIILLVNFLLVPTVFWLNHFHPFVAIKEFFFTLSIFLCLGIYLISCILMNTIVIRKTRLSLAVAVYYVYNLISFLVFPYTNQKDFFLFTCLILLFFLVSSSTDVSYRNKILQGVIVVALLSAVYTIFQFFERDIYGMSHLYFGAVKIGPFQGSRPFATFGHPNLLGGFCVFILPIISVFLIKALFARKTLLATCYSVVWGLSWVALFLSRSRGSWLAAAFALCVLLLLVFGKRLWFVFTRHKWRFGIILGSLLIVLAAGVLGLFVMTKQHTSLADMTSLGIRGEYYKQTWRMIQERPVFGRGFNTFNVYFPTYRDDRKAYQLGEMTGNYRVEHPHNEHLEILHDTGILGYGMFLWILVEALSLLMYQASIIEMGIVASIFGLLGDGMLSQSLRYVVIASLFWLLLGFAHIEEKHRNLQHQSTPQIRVGEFIGIVSVILLTIFPIWYAYRNMHADYFLRIGMGLYEQQYSRAAIEEFQKTLSLDTQNKRARYYLASAYNATGQNDEAFEQYLRLQEQDPNFLQINFHLGRLYFKRQDFQQAKAYFERQLRVNNMDWTTCYYLALIANHLHNPDQAIAYLRECEEIHALSEIGRDEYIKIQKTLAQLYINVTAWDHALSTLHKLKKIAPEEAWIDSVVEKVEKRMNASPQDLSKE